MNNQKKCSKIESQLIEYFSNVPDEIPFEIKSHIETCETCKIEFQGMQQALTILNDNNMHAIDVPDHLLISIESQLEEVEQARVHESIFSGTRNILMMEYTYISLLAITVWVALLLGQPLVVSWLQTYGLSSSEPILNDYGLFILFFIVGGFIALISSPLLIKMECDTQTDSRSQSLFKRFFSSNLSIFFC